LAHYTTPPAVNTSTTGEPKLDAFLTDLYAKDAALLEVIPTRKERRRQGGLVKLTTLSAEERQAAVEADWAGLQNDEDEESDDVDDDAESADVEGMDVDSEDSAKEEEGDEEEAEDDEEEPEEEVVVPPPRSNKQKRKAAESAPERPSKKVAFNTVVKAKASKPLKPVQAPAKKLPAVSALKTALKTKSAATKPSENKVAKVANKPSTKKAASSEAKKDDSAPQAYDFGKFF
jgi:nuclear GTP-binding protein